jgi:hypothetical protein
VSFFQFGAGDARLRYVDNLVTGQVANAGAPAAFVVNVSGGRARFEMLNNTAADSDLGILVSGRTDLGARVSGLVANNVVAHIARAGIGIDDELDVQNEFNLVFDTGGDFFTPGPGTVFSDPLFVGGGDFHLSGDSPAVNAGNNGRVPADVTTDLDGLPRVAGGRVDMGAFERQDVLERACAPQPLATCHEPGASSTAIRARRGELAWQWRNGTTGKAELGTPTSTTDYLLCLYDERASAPALVAQAAIPAGPQWTETPNGFRFLSNSGAPDGIRRLRLKAGAGTARIDLFGRGMSLPPLPLSQDRRVVVQLVNAEGACWTAEFPQPPNRNDLLRFVDE